LESFFFQFLPIFLHSNNSKPVTPEDIPNYFKDFYCKPVNNNTPSKKLSNNNQLKQSLYLSPTTADEVYSCIQSIRNGCANQHTCIPIKIIKAVALTISQPISQLVNLSFTSGKFPNMLKVGQITPIFKKNNKQDINNYRPVCVLPILSKVFEKLFLQRLSSFLHKYKILPPTQYGFTKNNNCQYAIMHSLLYITEALNKKYFASLVLLDLSKAFDSIDHPLLRQKLSRCGIRGIPLLWIDSYLKDRPFYVHANNLFSDIGLFQRGVPQGGILSPTLFNIFLADFPSTVQCNTVQYADDTNLLLSHRSLDGLVYDIKRYFYQCRNYFNQNGLTLNESKTEVIIFDPQKNEKRIIKLDRTTLTSSTAVKFLGVWLDNRLSMKEEVQSISRKICSLFSSIYSLRNCLSFHAKKDFYFAFIYSHIVYGSIFLVLSNLTGIAHIQSYYKRAVKCLFNKRRQDSWTSLKEETKILDVEKIIHKQICLLAHKLYHTNAHPHLSEYFKRSSSRTCNFVFSQHLITQKSLNNSILTAWNSLPTVLKSIPRHKQFKDAIKDNC